MPDSEPTKQARIWSKVLIGIIAGGVTTGTGIHFIEKPSDANSLRAIIREEIASQDARIDNRISTAIEPLNQRITELRGESIASKVEMANMKLVIYSRMDNISADLKEITKGVNETNIAVARMVGEKK